MFRGVGFLEGLGGRVWVFNLGVSGSMLSVRGLGMTVRVWNLGVIVNRCSCLEIRGWVNGLGFRMSYSVFEVSGLGV